MAYSLPEPAAGPPEPLWGEVGPEVHDVRVIYSTADQEPHELEVHVAQLSGELQRRVGSEYPFGVFVTFPPVPSDPGQLLDPGFSD
jgi:hypothetical protein